MNTDLRPASVSPPIAGRLLGISPPSAINQYRAAHPAEFPNGTARRFAIADLERHPLRSGRPVTVEEILAADRAEDGNRERYRHYNHNCTRKDVSHADR